MNILAIDYGTKRCGLAWAQTGLDIVLPFGVITAHSDEERVAAIKTLVHTEHIGLIVMGLPIGLDDELENFNTKRVKTFTDLLRKQVTLPIEFEDERFTSQEADAMGGDATRDEKAAMLILQAYLERQH